MPITHATERTSIHLIHSFENPNGGCEQRALNLYRLLNCHANVSLWCEHEPHPALLAEWPIRRIGPDGVPDDGTLVFVSTYYRVGAWLERARPKRLIIIYNIDFPASLNAWLVRVDKPWFPKPELVFASRILSQSTGRIGTVQCSPIDLSRFVCARDYVRNENAPCVVGRLSRDTPDKHYPGDMVLYRTLAERGYRVRIMGGTILQNALGNVPGIELLPEGAESAERFLDSLDIFLYRTNSNWFESWGRVIFEAMANGLPVVCHVHGGYAEKIRHGKNGFLYQTQEEAIAIIDTLRAYPAVRAAIGKAAQLEMQALLGADFEQSMLEYYIFKS
jgi:glycosyltransferase involved in cell wall biosynthesis